MSKPPRVFRVASPDVIFDFFLEIVEKLSGIILGVREASHAFSLEISQKNASEILPGNNLVTSPGVYWSFGP